MLNRAPLYDLSESDLNLYCLKNVFTYVLKLPWQPLYSSPPDPSPNALEAVRISLQVSGSLSLYEGSEDGIFPLNSPDSISLIQVLEVSAKFTSACSPQKNLHRFSSNFFPHLEMYCNYNM